MLVGSDEPDRDTRPAGSRTTALASGVHAIGRLERHRSPVKQARRNDEPSARAPRSRARAPSAQAYDREPGDVTKTRAWTRSAVALGAFMVIAACSSKGSGGGGGGGAGRIRINTKSSQATVSGVVSPATSTPCVTQGTVH